MRPASMWCATAARPSCRTGTIAATSRGQDLGLEEVLLGAVWGGSWSEHYMAWRPARRKHTLLLGYNALARGEEATLRAIADSSGINRSAFLICRSTHCTAEYPEFFRSGSDEKNIAELEAACPALFRLVHGRAMIVAGLASARRCSRAPGPAATNRPWPSSGRVWWRCVSASPAFPCPPPNPDERGGRPVNRPLHVHHAGGRGCSRIACEPPDQLGDVRRRRGRCRSRSAGGPRGSRSSR